MGAVYKKELKAYFSSVIGYVFVAFFVFIVSMFFSIYNLYAGNSLIRNSLSGVSFVFFIIIPILTMRIMADERKQKTDQMLYTAPVKISSIVLGKYFAMVTVFAIPVCLFCTYPLIMMVYGKNVESLAMDYVALLGFFLIGCMYLAIGMFLSSLTESQVIAAVLTFGVLLFTYFVSSLLAFIPNTAAASMIGFSITVIVITLLIFALTKNYIVAGIVGCALEIVTVVLFMAKNDLFIGAFSKVFGVFDTVSVLHSFYYGLIDAGNVLYYLSGCVLFIFLTVQAVQKRRYS